MSDCGASMPVYGLPERRATLTVDFTDGASRSFGVSVEGRDIACIVLDGVRLVPAPEPDWDDQEVTD